MDLDDFFIEIRFTYGELEFFLEQELNHKPTNQQILEFADKVRSQLREDVTTRGNVTIQTIAEEYTENLTPCIYTLNFNGMNDDRQILMNGDNIVNILSTRILEEAEIYEISDIIQKFKKENEDWTVDLISQAVEFYLADKDILFNYTTDPKGSQID